MNLSQYFQPVIEMPELARFPALVRRLIVSSAGHQRISVPTSPGAIVLSILGGVVSGLVFMLICFGVFGFLLLAYWHFGIAGFFLSLLGAFGIIGLGAAVSRFVRLHKMRKRIYAYLRSDRSQEITKTYSSQ